MNGSGERCYIRPMKAFVNVPVAPVRREPNDRSELVTQFLFGEPVDILQTSEQWRFCRSMVDQYEGWLDEKLIIATEKAHDDSSLAIDPLSQVDVGGRTLHLPAGSRLAGSHASGRLGRKPEESSRQDLVQTALKFIGAPYLWGGKTILGMDCSGLTQLVYALHGIALPRDAAQQVHVGQTVDFVELVESGDLAFFGNDATKITHVGLVMRTADFPSLFTDASKQPLHILHASGEVRIDAFDHQGIFRTDRNSYSHTLRVIQRIIP